MLLRTRISIVAALGFSVVLVLMAVASALRENMLEQRVADTALAGQAALWDETTEVESNRLLGHLAEIARLASFGAAISSDNRDAALKALTEAGLTPKEAGKSPGDADAALSLVAVIGANRETLFAAGAQSAGSILDASSLDRALAGEQVTGLRLIGADQAYLLAARPVLLAGGPAVLVVGRSAQPLLARLARRLSGAASLISLRGQLSVATDPALWTRVQAHLALAPRAAAFTQVDLDDRIYAVSSVPVNGISGGLAGAIVLISDTTAVQSASRTLNRLAIGVELLLVLLGVVGLNAYLWLSFRPLQSAIDALQALSRGDVSVRLDARGGDEIGRIGEAVTVFRRDAHALTTARALRERVRRRQESVIQRELTVLAETTDSEGRDALLALLNNPVGSERADDSLRQLAQVMGSLTGRIIDQHQRLSTMVVELREALRVKTQLIAIQQELEIAREMQLSFLPRAFEPVNGLAVHGTMVPAKEIGGDFFDFFQLDEHRVAITVAEVSGKGVPAAQFMAVSHTLLRAVAQFEDRPGPCLARLNDLLAADNERVMFVTLFYAVIDSRDGSIVYANAGHNPPYRLRADGGLQAIDPADGMALAILEDNEYPEHRMVLSPGDALFLYTDGVTEAFDPGQQMFGEARLESLLASLHGVPRQEWPQRVIDAVNRFEAGGPQTDDITCLIATYQGVA